MPRPVAPVIVIGMHRSGTTMVTQLLEQLGLFMGAVKEHNHEAVFFLKLNNWLLTQSGGAWDHPGPLRHLLGNPRAASLAVTYLEAKLSSPRAWLYLGARGLKHRSVAQLSTPWGWKDPRTTFTLPLWLTLFPDAKVVHIYRHGVDVVGSLQVRQERCLDESLVRLERGARSYRLYGRQERLADSLRCSTLDGGFSLWEAYLEEARRHLAGLGDRATEIRYEDFLADPQTHLSSLAAFCDLNASADALREAAGRVRETRAYAYRQNPDLAAFAAQVRARLEPHGYR